MKQPEEFDAEDFQKEKFFDATTYARDAGCALPVAISKRVWDQCIAWKEATPWDEVTDEPGNSQLGRAMALMAITSLVEQNGLDEAGTKFEFGFSGVPRRGAAEVRVPLVWNRWKSTAGGDFLTVMLQVEA